MGTVYRKTATKPLPPGAKLIVRKGQRIAEWIDAKQKRRTAPVTNGKDGTDRIVITARTYTAKYRDGSGLVREVATGCRDETAARSVLGKLERRAELVKGEVLTVGEAAVIDHQAAPLADHIVAYLVKLAADEASVSHQSNVRRALHRLAAECRFNRLSDLNRDVLERWLVSQQKAGMGARTRNTYRAAAVAFCNWCIETGRLLSNPFAKVAKAVENADPRRQRRALTEDELVRLLRVAQCRPLAEYGRQTMRRPKDQAENRPNRKRNTWTMLPLSPEGLDAAMARARQRLAENPALVARMEALGRERALIYKTLVLTGLRKGELASLTVGQLNVDADPPYLVLNAADEKNRQGSTLPLRVDLAADLREWLVDKAAALQQAAGEAATVLFDSEAARRAKRNRGDLKGTEGQSCLRLAAVLTLRADTPLFTVPRDLVRILDRDLAAAGIPKVDERGRTVDVHSLRHTFGTLLSRVGVAPRTAQAAMRHSDVNLTMNVYTDPKLLDVAGAVEALPSLPLGNGPQTEAAALSATGTDEMAVSQFAPGFAPTGGKPCILGSTLDKVTGKAERVGKAGVVAASACPVKQNNPLTTAVNGLLEERETGFEPATSSLGS